MKKTILIGALLLGTSVMLRAQNEHKVRMAFVGNSITAGVVDFGVTKVEEGYVAEFGKLLTPIYGDTVELMNYGLSGRNMLKRGANPFWNESAFPNALKYVPDICLIALGTNDSRDKLWTDVGQHDFLGDYQAMVDTFKVRNPDVIIFTCLPPPIFKGHPYSAQDPHLDSVLLNYTIPAIQQVAEASGTVVVDFHTPLQDSIQYFTDKLHPNEAGHERMAKILYDKVMELNIIDQVDAGNAYVSNFVQTPSPAAPGSTVTLTWSTIFADEVTLDGTAVDLQGTAEVVAEPGKTYTLAAKGSNNTSEFPLKVFTYVPVEKKLQINPVGGDYLDGIPTVLNLEFIDQYEREMDKNTSNVTWEFTDGNGEFRDQTDTSVVFVPVETGRVTIKATVGELSVSKSFNVREEPPLSSSDLQSRGIYPNPVRSTLYIDKLDMDEAQIQIFNVWGQVVLSNEIRKGTKTLNVSPLHAGLYFYRINFSDQSISGKFLKVD